MRKGNSFREAALTRTESIGQIVTEHWTHECHTLRAPGCQVDHVLFVNIDHLISVDDFLGHYSSSFFSRLEVHNLIYYHKLLSKKSQEKAGAYAPAFSIKNKIILRLKYFSYTHPNYQALRQYL